MKQIFQRKFVGTLALTPALSPGERENHSPSLPKICDWICRTVFQKINEARNGCSLSPGERVRVRAGVKPFSPALESEVEIVELPFA